MNPIVNYIERRRVSDAVVGAAVPLEASAQARESGGSEQEYLNRGGSEHTLRYIKRRSLSWEAFFLHSVPDVIKSNYNETNIEFLPTFKIDSMTKKYNIKKRHPGYTDRIFWKTTRRVKVAKYDSLREATGSDHDPVMLMMTVINQDASGSV